MKIEQTYSIDYQESGGVVYQVNLEFSRTYADQFYINQYATVHSPGMNFVNAGNMISALVHFDKLIITKFGFFENEI